MDEKLKELLANKEAAKMFADATKMRMALEIKQAVERDNDVELMCHTWELFTALVVARANLDPEKVLSLIADLTAALVKQIEFARQAAINGGLADKLGLNARR